MSSSLFIVVTGASRGFGRAMAIVAAKSFQTDAEEFYVAFSYVKIILVARSMEGLNETARLVGEQAGENASETMSVICHAMDLSDLGRLDENLDTLCQEFEMEVDASRKIIFIQNAGTIGHLGKCRETPSLKDLQMNVDLNVTSCLWTSVRLAKYAASAKISTDMSIINISSLVAVADFPTFGIYSAGKAARDKYHALIANEEMTDSERPTIFRIRTLNYAPGPLETAMVDEIRAKIDNIDASLQPGYRQRALDPMDSARKLFRLLEQDDFTSGCHIDYYDLPNAE